jgi:phenylpropionate dioxygenase-like ring-hydroxylating dioxygenase large terminal subunit
MHVSIIEHSTYFTSLPREYYLSEEIFREELAKVITRQWLYAGHVSMLPQPGSYYVRDVGPESLIITRDEAGRVRAFFNVCRHRGFRICERGASGHVSKAFVCPYHRWSFATDGRLLGAPGAPDGAEFDYRDWGLHEAHCGVWFGAVFVYLGQEKPPALEDEMASFTGNREGLALVEPERMKLIHREVYDIAANWKTALENNSECYHCAQGHPSLGIACDYREFFLRPEETGRDVRDLGGERYFPFRDGMSTFSMNGDWVCGKRLGTPQDAGFAAGWIVAPNYAAGAFFADHAVLMDVLPISATRTRWQCEWYVHADAVEGEDYEVQKVVDVFHKTNCEDVEFIERNYDGVTSTRYVPGPQSARREPNVKDSLTAYLRLMAA